MGDVDDPVRRDGDERPALPCEVPDALLDRFGRRAVTAASSASGVGRRTSRWSSPSSVMRLKVSSAMARRRLSSSSKKASSAWRDSASSTAARLVVLEVDRAARPARCPEIPGAHHGVLHHGEHVRVGAGVVQEPLDQSGAAWPRRPRPAR